MFADQLLARVRSIKDVRRAALGSFVPFDGKETLLTFSVQGEPDPRTGASPNGGWLSDGFFETLGVPLVKGRTFSPSDTETHRAWRSSAHRSPASTCPRKIPSASA